MGKMINARVKCCKEMLQANVRWGWVCVSLLTLSLPIVCPHIVMIVHLLPGPLSPLPVTILIKKKKNPAHMLKYNIYATLDRYIIGSFFSSFHHPMSSPVHWRTPGCLDFPMLYMVFPMLVVFHCHFLLLLLPIGSPSENRILFL